MVEPFKERIDFIMLKVKPRKLVDSHLGSSVMKSLMILY